MALAMVLLVVVLPSALRPPPDPATTSAEFSPDAPPDENQDSIVAALNRGTSGTAGTGTGDGPGEVAGEAVAEIAENAPPRACPRGFGNPPRQTESFYSAPCAKPFQGDNGGSTYAGVSATEVRVAWFHTLANNQASYEGKVEDVAKPGESAQDRTLRALQVYFNQTYQLFGRRLQLYAFKAGTSEEDQVAAGRRAVEEYDVFAANGVGRGVCDEIARLQRLCFIGQQREQYYESRAPYLWSWYPNATKMTEFAAEYLCKQLVGKPAEWAGDAAMRSTERRIGLFYVDTEEFAPIADEAEDFLRESCGETFVELVGVPPATQQEGGGNYATAVSRMKLANITTPVVVADFLSASFLTNTATAQQWFPEWFVPGAGAIDRNQLGQLQDQQQWANAFGFSGFEMELQLEETECYRAYKTIEPTTQPNYAICTWFFPSMLQIMNGIQLAGPDLNPRSFERGLFSQGYRFYDDPVWAIGGGFGPGDHTYMDNIVEIWWDPTADDPQSDRIGAYRHPRGGKRFRMGEIPTDRTAMFEDGITANEL